MFALAGTVVLAAFLVAFGGVALGTGARATVLYFAPDWADEDPTLSLLHPRRLIGHACSCDFCRSGWGCILFALLWRLLPTPIDVLLAVLLPAIGVAWLVASLVSAVKLVARGSAHGSASVLGPLEAEPVATATAGE